MVAGFATELLAASTRVIPPGIPLFSGLYFGAVYFIGAFAISYYNQHNLIKDLCWYGILGLVLEITVGISADLSRTAIGGPMLTPYFAVGLLAGLMVGYFVGQSLREGRLQREMASYN